MMEDRDEIVLVLRPGVDAGTDIAGVEVIHYVSSDVMVVRVRPGFGIEPPSGVEVVYAGADPPPRVLAELEDTQRLFVEAWRTRRSGSKRQRPGEGLPWDAKDMSPPDLPPEQPDTT